MHPRSRGYEPREMTASLPGSQEARGALRSPHHSAPPAPGGRKKIGPERIPAGRVREGILAPSALAPAAGHGACRGCRGRRASGLSDHVLAVEAIEYVKLPLADEAVALQIKHEAALPIRERAWRLGREREQRGQLGPVGGVEDEGGIGRVVHGKSQKSEVRSQKPDGGGAARGQWRPAGHGAARRPAA